MNATPSPAPEIFFDIRLNEAQGTELLRLLDIAVKAAGLSVAQNALFLSNLIQSSHAAAIKKVD